MAASAGENVTQVSSMPVPPLNYVKLYTDENIKAGRAPRWTFSEFITIVLT